MVVFDYDFGGLFIFGSKFKVIKFYGVVLG